MEFSITHRDGTEQNDNFYFLYFSAFSNLFWLEMKPQWYCLIFWFFALFMEFSITRRIGTKRNDNFYFISFSAFSNLFCLEMKSQWYFLNFWFFSLFFWNFLFPVKLERNGETIFIFSLSRPFPTYFGLEWSHNGIFWFSDFFSLFLEFSITCRVRTERKDNFYFFSFSAFSNLFWLEMKP